MLIGKTCRVGSGYDINVEGFSYVEGVIVSEPLMENTEDNYVYVIVQVGDRLQRCDIDYIYYLTHNGE